MESKKGWETRTGETPPVEQGRLTVVPHGRSVVLRGKGFGWVWNRPTHLVLTMDGDVQRVPIPDRTRQLQVLFLGAGVLFWLAGWIISGQKRSSKDDKST